MKGIKKIFLFILLVLATFFCVNNKVSAATSFPSSIEFYMNERLNYSSVMMIYKCFPSANGNIDLYCLEPRKEALLGTYSYMLEQLPDVIYADKKNGVTLQILDNSGKEVKDIDEKLLKWISTEEEHYIEGLPAGKYILVEISSPDGYVLNEERIEFELKNDVEMVSVVIYNTPIIDASSNSRSFIYRLKC